MILSEPAAIDRLPSAREPRRHDGRVPQISAVFPSIRHVRVEVLESGVGLSLHRPARRVVLDGPIHLPCSNPYCIGGGLALLPHLQEMVAQRLEHRELSFVCGGSEFFHNVPLGPLCPNTFLVALRLQFA